MAFLVSNYNIHGVDEDTLSSIEDIVKYYDVLTLYYELMGSDKLQRFSRERKIYQNLLDRFKDAKRQRIAEAQEAKAEAERLRIIDKPIESVAQMFKEAENEASIDESIESAVQMFDNAEIEAARTASQAVVNQSSYFKFGQFFKSMWSKFTESKLGQMFNFVKSYFFQN